MIYYEQQIRDDLKGHDLPLRPEKNMSHERYDDKKVGKSGGIKLYFAISYLKFDLVRFGT